MSPRTLMHQLQLTLVSVSLAILAMLGSLTVPQAAEIQVNTFDDELNTDGDCSLREAITAANTDAAVDACPAGNGSDLVRLGVGSWTISYFGQDGLAIQSALSLVGAGADHTILSGDGRSRLLHVFSDAATEIVGITLTKGRAADGAQAVWDETPGGDGGNGGAILNEGVLLVQQCIVRDSVAGDGGSLVVPFPLPQAGRAMVVGAAG